MFLPRSGLGVEFLQLFLSLASAPLCLLHSSSLVLRFSGRNTCTAGAAAYHRYIPKVLKDFWRSQDGYLAHDWTDLRLTLESIYDDTLALSRHSEQKLMEFVKQSFKHCMNDEEDVLQYYQHFLVLSKPLLDSHWLTYSECD